MYSKNNVALTPPMGWNSYDYYDTTVTEEEIRETAVVMAEKLKPYGYEYIVVDIQWSDGVAGTDRAHYQYINFSPFKLDEYSRQLPAENRFPSSSNGEGFKPLADYIHSLGLKFGIHIMRGIPRYAAHTHMKLKGTDKLANEIANPYSICKWNPDMYGVDTTKEGAQAYYNSIFELYASWGVDFVKVDDICNTSMYPENPYSAEKEIEMIAKAIENSGREMVLSLSPGPAIIEKAWHLEKYANMWRITDDFWDNWDSLKDMFRRCEVWQNHVSIGGYPDCDMLPIGKLGKGFRQERMTYLTHEEQRTMMTLWCIFHSPLMIGADIRQLDEWTLSLLTNESVLGMEKYAQGARQVERTEEYAVWCSRDTRDKSYYIAIFNLLNDTQEIRCHIEELISKYIDKEFQLIGEYKMIDLWNKQECMTKGHIIENRLDAHACALYQLLK